MPYVTDEDYSRPIVGVEELKSRLSSENAESSPLQQRHAAIKQQTTLSGKGYDVWLSRQKLQDACHDLIVSNNGNNAELAVTKRVEQDLWNHAFRQQITQLENQLEQQSTSNMVHIAATRTSLQYFLELATGFYLQLMEEISIIASLDVYPLCRDRDHFGALCAASVTGLSLQPTQKMPKPIATYLVQHCLVHLGDLARYMAKLAPSGSAGSENSPSFAEASVDHLEIAQHYYVAAAMLTPFTGQPFNQMAIVEAQQGNRLGAAYLYARALSARSPFPAAEQNLTRLLERILSSSPLVRDKQQSIAPPKSIAELVAHCIQLLATAWLKPSSSTNSIANVLLSHLGNSAHSFLSDRAGSTFSWFQLVQLAFLNCFIVSQRHHTQQGKAAFSFTILFLNNLVRELTSVAKADNTGGVHFGRSPLLPATRLILSFLAVNAGVLLNNTENISNIENDTITAVRSSRLWHSIAKLADIASAAAAKSSLPYSCPLPEDVELRGSSIFNDSFSQTAKSAPGIDDGASPDRTIDTHIDFECGIYLSYTSSMSSTANTSGAATAFLACARFSDTCVRLASAAPTYLMVVSSDPCTRFASPLPLPVPSSTAGQSFVPMQQPYMNSVIDGRGNEVGKIVPPSSLLSNPVMPAVISAVSAAITSNLSNSSSSVSSAYPNSTANNVVVDPVAAGAIGERPRNVVFQSIVHTIRARGQVPVGAAQTGSSSASQSPRLPVASITAIQKPSVTGFSQQPQTNSSLGMMAGKNHLGFGGNGGGSNEDISDGNSRQGAVHRNLPPRLARLAEAESRNTGPVYPSPRGLPSHINLSSSTSSSSSSASTSSMRQQPPPQQSFQNPVQNFRPPPTIPVQREQGIAPKYYQDFQDGRNGRNNASAFQSSKMPTAPNNSMGNLSDDLKNRNSSGFKVETNSSGQTDDGWPVLAYLRSHLSDSAPHLRNIQSESSMPASKNNIRMQGPTLAGSVPTTLNEMNRKNVDAPPSTTRAHSASVDRATNFSLFGPSTQSSDNNWLWSMSTSSAASSSNVVTEAPSTSTGSSLSVGGGGGGGWSPMLSSVSPFVQNKTQPSQIPAASTGGDLLLSSLTSVQQALNLSNNSNTTNVTNVTKDSSNTSLFGCHSITRNVVDSSLLGGESGGTTEFGGWSQLEPNGISPTRLWSAFGFDLHKNHQVRDSESAGAPPTPPN